MKSTLSDSELDNLFDDSNLDLEASINETLCTPPAEPLAQKDLKFFGNIPVSVTLEVASTEISLRELMDVGTSSVIALDKLAGAPLDVKVNGAPFGKAEVVVVNGNYGLRIVELSGSNLSDLAG
ncbi:flagellar motor switch protein FliN [Pseudomonas plecoglossicida]|uniref:Flagellar motor switch protein FliN n=1 Tax=Pseudomonas plecoglossicida TaxID=70775 RepID=A0AAD0VV92_PSEDL|nr:flagellar motor switch protein FliN [Pseudomonas plecoglossicida]AXM98864.1 flagellar motor switch protein FliN [Pseudomonas plecoglossicida]EPB95232.1 flagellar motor switch protein FliN [Pseudomonas plecoglossicida NB2011]QLB55012.1 flagellar motor switch protein FliN [Pseudomonas plecoglossicida]GLR35380.1 flagellar motor switch protein FliN [Pseudomonas plecoglossicida]